MLYDVSVSKQQLKCLVFASGDVLFEYLWTLGGLREAALNRWELKTDISPVIEGWKDGNSDFIIPNQVAFT